MLHIWSLQDTACPVCIGITACTMRYATHQANARHCLPHALPSACLSNALALHITTACICSWTTCSQFKMQIVIVLYHICKLCWAVLMTCKRMGSLTSDVDNELTGSTSVLSKEEPVCGLYIVWAGAPSTDPLPLTTLLSPLYPN